MRIAFYTFLLISFLINFSNSQILVPGCTTLEITELPSYQGDLIFWTQATMVGGESCAALFHGGYPSYLVRSFILSKKNEFGTFVQVASQISPYFTNLDQGTYRVQINTPTLFTVTACPAGFETYQSGSSIFLGYLGFMTSTFTNEAVVGPTAAEDRVAELTGSTASGAPTAFNSGDHVFLDATESQNYTMYFLSIKERGSIYNRYASTGWVHEQAGVLNLIDFWDSFGYDFEIAHSYEVQFVIENRRCRHGIESPLTENIWWTETNNFFVCNPAWNCREGVGIQPMTIGPNPAGNFIQVSDFDPTYDHGYTFSMYDLTGRLRKHIIMQGSHIDISELQNGMYIVQILKDQIPVINSKVLVQK